VGWRKWFRKRTTKQPDPWVEPAQLDDAALAARLQAAWNDYEKAHASPGTFWLESSLRNANGRSRISLFLVLCWKSRGAIGASLFHVLFASKRPHFLTAEDRAAEMNAALRQIEDLNAEIARRVAARKPAA
jgi:hypothetical protein